LLAALGLAAPAAAQSAVRVGYSDLNLQSPNGAKVMLARLDAAAPRACGPAPKARDRARATVYGACVNETVGGAVAALGAPLVTAAYGGAVATDIAAAGGLR